MQKQALQNAEAPSELDETQDDVKVPEVIHNQNITMSGIQSQQLRMEETIVSDANVVQRTQIRAEHGQPQITTILREEEHQAVSHQSFEKSGQNTPRRADGDEAQQIIQSIFECHSNEESKTDSRAKVRKMKQTRNTSGEVISHTRQASRMRNIEQIQASAASGRDFIQQVSQRLEEQQQMEGSCSEEEEAPLRRRRNPKSRQQDQGQGRYAPDEFKRNGQLHQQESSSHRLYQGQKIPSTVEDFGGSQRTKLTQVKRQADRTKGSLATRLRVGQRGTSSLHNMKIGKSKRRSICSWSCGGSAFKDKLYAFFISHFDASLILLPFLFKRAGSLTCSLLIVFFAFWSYFTSILMYECVRMLLGNYHMRQNGVDFELLLANFKHISTHGSHQAFGISTPWLSYTFTSSAAIGLAKYVYILSMVLQSAIGLILCQYTIDDLVQWADQGTVFALQLLPEAKFLSYQEKNKNTQPFAYNYFALSAGFGFTLILSIFYGLIFSPNQKQRGPIQGFKCLVIIIFLTVTIMSSLKPYLHMSAHGDLRVDDQKLYKLLEGLDLWTPSFGLTFGILAYSSTLSQQAAVPELLLNSQDPATSGDSPSKDYFRLPLFLGTFLACSLKCIFGIVGAMMFTEESNLFANMLFSDKTPDAVLISLALFSIVVLLPQAIDLQKQAKYFASISSENDAIPCNRYLVGLLLPWFISAIVSHLQIFVYLINWTSLICVVMVSVTCSLLMWTTQMDEALVHETNFRESITMLVVQDDQDSLGGDSSGRDSDTDAMAHKNLDHIKAKSNIENMSSTRRAGTQGLVSSRIPFEGDSAQAERNRNGFTMVDMKSFREARDGVPQDFQGRPTSQTPMLNKDQQHHANIAAARRFLAMGEQRDSHGASEASQRSSFDPDAQYVAKYAETNKSQVDKRDGRQNNDAKGLSAQVLKKNTLDKKDYSQLVAGNRNDVAISATAGAIADDNESQNPQRSDQEKDKVGDTEGQNVVENSYTERYSHEFSQNVEVNSNRSSEIKYLIGERLDAGELERRQTNAPAAQGHAYVTFEQKQQSVEQRFVKVYNQQGHFSTAQSIMRIYGATICSIARAAQCIICCRCMGCCRIHDSVGYTRFLINLTKLAALLMIASTLAFIIFATNEHIAMESKNGAGAFLFKNATFPPLPKQALG